MDPIKMTVYNETLLEYPQSTQTDESELYPGVLGVHDVCRGWIDLEEVSKTHWALVCRSCKLRVVVPNTLKTFRALREHLSSIEREAS